MRCISAAGRWLWTGKTWQLLTEGAAATTASSVPPEACDSPAPPGPLEAVGFIPTRFDESAVRVPRGGISVSLHRLSHGLIDLGPGAAERRRQGLLLAACTPAVDPPRHVAVASAKGGVGKSTMALLLASRLGLLRTDRIIAVECNPHHGTFRSRIRTQR